MLVVVANSPRTKSYADIFMIMDVQERGCIHVSAVRFLKFVWRIAYFGRIPLLYSFQLCYYLDIYF